ncbi:acyl-CoA synthetase (AMP-forming)/AMP-acid ligase II [Sporosarcina luteola]|nr:acyl-CoA synthetase (AMP-forming)/AMP-acid ligase II [Sporosarcina luteola]
MSTVFYENWNLGDRPAVVTLERTYTYEELNTDIEVFGKKLQSGEKELVVLLCTHTYELLVAYLAALRAGHAVMLVSGDLDIDLLTTIMERYQPKWIIGSRKLAGYEQVEVSVWRKSSSKTLMIHPKLAVLLSTSGTTGSQKFVRLSYENLQSNAVSIVSYLRLDEQQRGLANLPLSYSYGLSIVNSHLEAGATILLTDESVMAKSFWVFLNEQRATSFGGVPFTYQMLQRIGFLKMNLPYLQMFTQAGGRLDDRLVKLFGEYAEDQGKQFFVMYGQTEAAPRMSYIPPNRLLEKESSIGIAIPGGTFCLDPNTSELIYKGPNVMMGYAESLEDLAKGDEMNGVLPTGDLATVDDDGFYSITGRLKRFVKLFGLRVNLDEVERKLEQELQNAVACTGSDDRMIVVVESEPSATIAKAYLESAYQLHKSSFRILVEEIPRLSNGKMDYQAIKDGLV